MTAVSEYKKWGDVVGALDPSDVALGFRLADAAIVGLKATIERMKVCGNCGHDKAVDDCCDDCSHDDSRWTARAEEGSKT